MISVGEFVSPQTPLVTLVRTDPLRIELVVPQQHLRAVQRDQTVRIHIDSFDDEIVGTIRYVSASVRRESRGLTVEAVIPNPGGELRPGLFATARIETGTTEEVAVVPPGAVLTSAGVNRVFVVRGGTVEERVISIAERSATGVVVADGVSPGEVVAIDQLDRLADGAPVTVTPAAGEPAAATAGSAG